MTEIGYAVRDLTQVLVASEESESTTGYDYTRQSFLCWKAVQTW
jgi:hypothetical protein